MITETVLTPLIQNPSLDTIPNQFHSLYILTIHVPKNHIKVNILCPSLSC